MYLILVFIPAANRLASVLPGQMPRVSSNSQMGTESVSAKRSPRDPSGQEFWGQKHDINYTQTGSRKPGASYSKELPARMRQGRGRLHPGGGPGPCRVLKVMKSSARIYIMEYSEGVRKHEIVVQFCSI